MGLFSRERPHSLQLGPQFPQHVAPGLQDLVSLDYGSGTCMVILWWASKRSPDHRQLKSRVSNNSTPEFVTTPFVFICTVCLSVEDKSIDTGQDSELPGTAETQGKDGPRNPSHCQSLAGIGSWKT